MATNGKFIDFLIKKMIIPFAYAYMQLVAWTSHWRSINRSQIEQIKKKGETVIFAFWHNQLVLMPYLYKNSFTSKKVSVLISWSKDGEYIKKVVEYFKFDVVRGSTSQGGRSAFRGLIERLKQGYLVGITPDGPRGPRYKVQKGVILLAQLTGCRIIPVACDTSWKMELRTWDRLRVPLPMGNMYAICGKPIPIHVNASKTEIEKKQQELENELIRINKEAKRRVAWWVGKRN